MRASSPGRTASGLVSCLLIAVLVVFTGSLTPAAAAYPTKGAIGSMHRSLGGDKGRLGPAVGPERCTLKDKAAIRRSAPARSTGRRRPGRGRRGAHPLRVAEIRMGEREARLPDEQRVPVRLRDPSGLPERAHHVDGEIGSKGPSDDGTVDIHAQGLGVRARGRHEPVRRQGMAAQGKSATQILEHYYNPATVTQTASNANADITVQLLAGQKSVTLTPSAGRLRVKVSGRTIESGSTITVERTSQAQSGRRSGRSRTSRRG